MADKLPTGELSSLAFYLKEILFEQFKADKEDLVRKMHENLDDFNGCIPDTLKEGEGEDWRSDAVPPSTKIKVLVAYSLVIDILLQGGKVPFTFKPSPWDEIQFDDLPEDQQSTIQGSINEAVNLVEQQFLDSHFDRELMKIIMSKAIYGESYAKRFVHKVVRKGWREENLAPEGIESEEFIRWIPWKKEKNAPGIRYASNWNIFRDMETDDLQKSAGIIERDLMSAFDLRSKIGKPFWLTEPIEKAIKMSSQKGATELDDVEQENLQPLLRDKKHRYKTMQRLECWCRIPTSVVEQFKAEMEGKEGFKRGDFGENQFDHSGKETEIYAVMAGDEVVRFVELDDTVKRPYYRDIWEIKLDYAEANGVSDNNHAMMKVLTGFVRAFIDNKILSGNVLLAIKEKFLPGFDGKLKPGTNIKISDDCEDARAALQQITIQDVGESLLSAIGIFERYQDEVTQLPKILQGATLGKEKPDTLGEINILQQNSGKYIGGVLKNTDEGLIEPVVNDFHEYNMNDPEEPKGKGNFIGEALGYTLFQDRVIRITKLMQGLNLVLSNPELMAETKLKEVLREIWKASDVDPDQYLKSPEEKAQDDALRQEATAQQEAKIRQIQSEQLQIEETQKQLDHAREIEKIGAKVAGDKEKQDGKAEDDLDLQDAKAQDDLVLQDAKGDDAILLEREKESKRPGEVRDGV